MVRVDFNTGRESFESQSAAGRYNPAMTIKLSFRRKRYEFIIDAGGSDDVAVFREGSAIYVLSLNHRMNYCGLQRFELDGRETGNVFLQADYEIADCLGPRGLDLRDTTIVKRLSEHLS